ncbi:CD2-associated protein [Planoprotostelium fungivorum]|uniref:CD2-associated protein n=1 Tax=Planoprotostelium fungivorum TaxID=1890364 RepID=A0A2P6NLG0_9EUKA|nr:CD2-associated protein [Planoprotostelium fungivorum]
MTRSQHQLIYASRVELAENTLLGTAGESSITQDTQSIRSPSSSETQLSYRQTFHHCKTIHMTATQRPSRATLGLPEETNKRSSIRNLFRPRSSSADSKTIKKAEMVIEDGCSRYIFSFYSLSVELIRASRVLAAKLTEGDDGIKLLEGLKDIVDSFKALVVTLETMFRRPMGLGQAVMAINAWDNKLSALAAHAKVIPRLPHETQRTKLVINLMRTDASLLSSFLCMNSQEQKAELLEILRGSRWGEINKADIANYEEPQVTFEKEVALLEKQLPTPAEKGIDPEWYEKKEEEQGEVPTPPPLPPKDFRSVEFPEKSGDLQMKVEQLWSPVLVRLNATKRQCSIKSSESRLWVDFTGAVLQPHLELNGQEEPLCFTVFTTDVTITLRATTTKQKEEWTELLQRACEPPQPVFLGPPSPIPLVHRRGTRRNMKRGGAAPTITVSPGPENLPPPLDYNCVEKLMIFDRDIYNVVENLCKTIMGWGGYRKRYLNGPRRSSRTLQLAGGRFVCHVLYDYVPQDSTDLALAKNDMVEILEQTDDGWCRGYNVNTGDTGVFPSNFVHFLEHQDTTNPAILREELHAEFYNWLDKFRSGFDEIIQAIRTQPRAETDGIILRLRSILHRAQEGLHEFTNAPLMSSQDMRGLINQLEALVLLLQSTIGSVFIKRVGDDSLTNMVKTHVSAARRALHLPGPQTRAELLFASTELSKILIKTTAGSRSKLAEGAVQCLNIFGSASKIYDNAQLSDVERIIMTDEEALRAVMDMVDVANEGNSVSASRDSVEIVLNQLQSIGKSITGDIYTPSLRDAASILSFHIKRIREISTMVDETQQTYNNINVLLETVRKLVQNVKIAIDEMTEDENHTMDLYRSTESLLHLCLIRMQLVIMEDLDIDKESVHRGFNICVLLLGVFWSGLGSLLNHHKRM